MQRPSCTVHHAHLHLSASFSFLLPVSRSKLSIFFSVFFHQLLIFFRWKHFSLGAWQETTEFCDTSMLHIVMHIYICLLQVLFSYDQLCYQAKQIMSMCTWMVYMHKCFAVDSWVQPVTSVSIVFHSETGQQGFSGGYAPNPHTSLPLPLPLFFFSFYRNWLLTDALQASLLLEKNPPAAPELPLLLQWCTQKECVLLGWWKNRSGGGRYIVSNVARWPWV